MIPGGHHTVQWVERVMFCICVAGGGVLDKQAREAQAPAVAVAVAVAL